MLGWNLARRSAVSTLQSSSSSNGLDTGNDLVKFRLDIMLRQPAQVRPVGDPGPQKLIRLPFAVCSLLLRHPPPLLRERVDATQEPVHERASGLIVQLQSLVQLFRGGLRWSVGRHRSTAGGRPDVGQGEGERVGVVDGEGAADCDAAAVGVGCVAEKGYVAVEDE